MQLSQTIQDAMNAQIQKEFASAYLYLAMASYFAEANLNGFANWMRVQAREERNHALKFFDYIHDRNAHAELDAVPKPAATWASPLAAFEAARKHEEKVSASIRDIYDLAVKEKDYASQALLQWFIVEQVEEEKTGREIVDTLKLIGDNRAGLFMYDKELGKRTGE
ncbi:MAG: ferritin [Gemmatimonadales bacterium]